MSNLGKKSNKSKLVYILFKWRKFLFFNLFFVVLITTIVSFLIPKTYKSSATITLSSSSSQGLGGLGSLLSGNSALSFGAKLLGGGGTDTDLLLGILNSQGVLKQIIQKYNLIDYYGISDSSLDRTIKSLKSDYYSEVNEFGFIEVSMIHESPQIAKSIVSDVIGLADKINVDISIEQAKRNRIFIEKRFLKNKEDLKKAEKDFNNFQKEFGVYAIDEQLRVGISAIAQLQAQIVQKETQLKIYESSISQNSNLITALSSEISSIKTSLDDLKKKKNDESELFFSMKDIPDIQLKYIRLFREVEIQNKVLEFMYPLYEQALMDENRNMSSTIFLDEPSLPDMKYSPKKALIILSAAFLGLFVFTFLILRWERQLKYSSEMNEVELIELNFVKKYILGLYRFKWYD